MMMEIATVFSFVHVIFRHAWANNLSMSIVIRATASAIAGAVAKAAGPNEVICAEFAEAAYVITAKATDTVIITDMGGIKVTAMNRGMFVGIRVMNISAVTVANMAAALREVLNLCRKTVCGQMGSGASNLVSLARKMSSIA